MRILRRLILAILTIGGLTTTFIATPASALPCVVCATPIEVDIRNCGFYADFRITVEVSLPEKELVHFALIKDYTASIVDTKWLDWPRLDPWYNKNAVGYQHLRIGSPQPLTLLFHYVLPGFSRDPIPDTVLGYFFLNLDLSVPVTQLTLPFSRWNGSSYVPSYAFLNINATQTTTTVWHC
jgi:hypothetical protein